MKNNEVELLKNHRQRKYKYGDESVLHPGKKIKRGRGDWLEGLTPEQISELVIPSSEDEHFRMWVDENYPNATPEQLTRLKKHWDDWRKDKPWDIPDYSQNAVSAMKRNIKLALESNPYMRWAFERHGAPIFALWSANAIDAYEAQPSIREIIDTVSKLNNYKTRGYVKAKLSVHQDLVLFHPRAAIDMLNADGEQIPMSLGVLHEIVPGDSHVDKSLSGTILHEWAHWLHYKAKRSEFANNKYGSGDKNNPQYQSALDIAREYAPDVFGDNNNLELQLIKLHEDGIGIEDTPDIPRTTTSYAHASMSEMIAESVAMVLHPNQQLSRKNLNAKARRDAEILLGGDGESYRPWETHPAREAAVYKKRISQLNKKERKERISSGKTDVFGIENEKINRPKFEREPTQLEYQKGTSPESRIFNREVIRDRINLGAEEISEFIYTDSSGFRKVVYAEGVTSQNLPSYFFPMEIAKSTNFDVDEIIDIFQGGTKTRLTNFRIPEGRFFVNLHHFTGTDENNNTLDGRPGSVEWKDSVEIDVINSSKFFGYKPISIRRFGSTSAGASFHWLEFDARTEEGQQILKALIVKQFMDDWATSSHQPLSRLLQTATQQLFSTEKIRPLNKEWNDTWTDRQLEFGRSIISDLHELTQSYFKSKGITHLNLYRGLLIKEDNLSNMLNDDNSIDIGNNLHVVSVVGNALSSWTSDLSIAAYFSQDSYTSSKDKKAKRVHLKQVVPVGDVIGMHLFNFGTMGESEFVVLGTEKPAIAHVVPENASFPDSDDIEMGIMPVDEGFSSLLKADDDDFFANAHMLIEKLETNGDKDSISTAQNLRAFVEKRDESMDRLSSGRIAKTKQALSQAFKFRVKKFDDSKPMSETRDGIKKLWLERAVVEKLDNKPITDAERKEYEDILIELDQISKTGILTPDYSLRIAAEISEDASRIINIGPGRSISDDIRLSKETIDQNPLDRSHEVPAKRAVAEILAELSDVDVADLTSLFYSIDSIVELFPEQYRDTLKKELTRMRAETDSKWDVFGLTDEITEMSEEDFDRIMQQRTKRPFVLGKDLTPQQRAAYVDKKAFIRNLIKTLVSGKSTNEDDYKFRVSPSTGEVYPGDVTKLALELSNVNAVRKTLLGALVNRAFSGGDSAKPEERLVELFPSAKEVLDFINTGDILDPTSIFQTLPENQRIIAQSIMEQIVDDFFFDMDFFDGDIKEGETTPAWPYGIMPDYHRKRMYDLLTQYGGLTDDEMRMLGYYRDNADFQNTISAVASQINRFSPKSRQRRSQYKMFLHGSRMAFEDGDINIDNMRYYPGDEKESRQLRKERIDDLKFQATFKTSSLMPDSPEPKLSDLNDMENRSGAYANPREQMDAREADYNIRRRRRSYKKILDDIFYDSDTKKPKSTQRILRITVADHAKGHTGYLFEDGEKEPQQLSLDRPLSAFIRLQPRLTNKRVYEIALPDDEEKALQKIDEFLSIEHFKSGLSLLTGELKEADEYFGDQDKNVQIRDSESLDTSKLDRSRFRDTINQLSDTAEFDIRTPEGQKAIKQVLMSQIVASWAASSNKVALSFLMQEVAAEEFGIKGETADLTDILGPSLVGVPGVFKVFAQMKDSGDKIKIPENQKTVIRSILRSMRDATQEYFKEKGITHIPIYRGMNLREADLPKELIGGKP